MSATSFLFLLIAIFVILNAGNLAQVAQGNAHFSFMGSGKRTDVSSGVQKPVSHGADPIPY